MGIYKWVLPRDIIIDTGVEPDFGAIAANELHFADDDGTHWLSIDVAGRWHVRAGYAWDGCSPKFRLPWGWLIGVPDGDVTSAGYQKAYIPSLAHDIGYQFLDAQQFPYSREKVDEIFHMLLVARGFYNARLYYWAVRFLGGVFRKI